MQNIEKLSTISLESTLIEMIESPSMQDILSMLKQEGTAKQPKNVTVKLSVKKQTH